jgi:tRNA(Arg) A34 adenosine deaminase TadA
MPKRDDEIFIRTAIRLSEQAMLHGDQPYAALVVKDGEIIVQAESRTELSGDSTRHSEIIVLSQLTQMLDRQARAGCTLYCSSEPCAMCASAAYWAGIGRVVFGCSNEMLSKYTDDYIKVNSRDILTQGIRKVEVVGPVLEDEAVMVLKRHWEMTQTGRGK